MRCVPQTEEPPRSSLELRSNLTEHPSRGRNTLGVDVLVRRSKLSLTNELNNYTHLLDELTDGRFSPLLDRGATNEELDQAQTKLGRQMPPEIREFYQWSRGTVNPGDNVFLVGGIFPAFISTLWHEHVQNSLLQYIEIGYEGPRFAWPLIGRNETRMLVSLDPDTAGTVWYIGLEGAGLFQVHDTLEHFAANLTVQVDALGVDGLDSDHEDLEVDGPNFLRAGLTLDIPPGQPRSLWTPPQNNSNPS